jgi:hypothetical protein
MFCRQLISEVPGSPQTGNQDCYRAEVSTGEIAVDDVFLMDVINRFSSLLAPT